MKSLSLSNTCSSLSQDISDINKPYYISPTYKSMALSNLQSKTIVMRETKQSLVGKAKSIQRDKSENETLGSETSDTVYGVDVKSVENVKNQGNFSIKLIDAKKNLREEHQRDLVKIEKRRQEMMQRRKQPSVDSHSQEKIDYTKMMSRRKTEASQEKSDYIEKQIYKEDGNKDARMKGHTRQGLSISAYESPRKEGSLSEKRDSSSSRERVRSQEKVKSFIKEILNIRHCEKVWERSPIRSRELTREIYQAYYSGDTTGARMSARGRESREKYSIMNSPATKKSLDLKDCSGEKKLSQTVATLHSEERKESIKEQAIRDYKFDLEKALENKMSKPVAKSPPKTENKSLNIKGTDKPAKSIQQYVREKSGAIEAPKDKKAPEKVLTKAKKELPRPKVSIEAKKKTNSQINNKKPELSVLSGKKIKVPLDIIQEDPSLHVVEDSFEEDYQIASMTVRETSGGKNAPHIKKVASIKGFSTINHEAKALTETGKQPLTWDDNYHRAHAAHAEKSKDILETLMERRKDLLSYLRTLKGKIGVPKNEVQDFWENIKGGSMTERVANFEDVWEQTLTHDHNKTISLKSMNDHSTSQVVERKRSIEKVKKVEKKEDVQQKKGQNTLGSGSRSSDQDNYIKQMKALQQYKRELRFSAYPENYTSAGKNLKI